MTTRGGDVGITISAQDRASPVMQRVGRNLNVMQRNVATLTTAMGVMDRTTGGILRSLTPFIGTFSVAGLAIASMSTALSFGIRRLKETQDQQHKTAEASQKLRNNFMLSGFSASAARGSVEELRGSLSRLQFQTLPGLDFEMQGFIANLDKASKTRFSELAQILKDMGIPEAEAMNAIGEAMQENFGPISKLLMRSITSFEEFTSAMASAKESVKIDKSIILTAFEDLVGGAGTFEDRLKQFLTTLQNNPKAAAESMKTNGDIIRGILLGLSEEQRLLLEKTLMVWTKETSIPVQVQAARRQLGPVLLGMISDVQMVGDNHEFLRRQVISVSSTYAGRWAAMADATNQQANRIVDDAERAIAALARMAAAASGTRLVPLPPGIHGPPSPIESLVPFEDVVIGGESVRIHGGGETFSPFQHGAIVTRPTNARIGEIPELVTPLSRLPSLLEGIGGGGKVIHISLEIGGQVWRDLVINTLNDEVSLREPSLGLG